MATAVAIAGLLAGLVVLLPTSLGGATTYVTTHGISMEPRFHTGDLAILRTADHYGVGDVVGYRSTTLHTVVMHRIVGVRDGHFVMKGDNNHWLDPDRPTPAQVVGRLALRVPHGGVWLAWLSSPAVSALLVLLAVVGGGATVRRRRRRRLRTTSAVGPRPTRPRPTRPLRPRPSRPRPAPAPLPLPGGELRAEWRETTHHSRPNPPLAGVLQRVPTRLRPAAWTICGAAAVAVLLGALAFSSAPSSVVLGSASTGDSATFGYTATVRASAAYDSTTVRSPDPVFRRLVRSVVMSVRYDGTPATLAVQAQLTTPGGWHTALPLVATQAVDGHGTAVSAPLDLAAIDARARAAAQATGIAESQVDVRLTATITRGPGLLFTPHVDLVLTPQQLVLATGAPLTVADPATVVTRTARDETVALPLFDLTVAHARRLSELLLLAALLSGAALGLSVRDAAPESEADAIRYRHRRVLVGVRPGGVPTDVPVVDVESFAALLAVAERSNRMVLHWTTDGLTTFVVPDDTAAYRYRSGVPADTQRPLSASTARV
ncbi:MAG: signal peptidase I [Jatrophihabitans sp.]|uniref:signal peptidase I n=1 Tax=Jatrophihabitans sp. TaxID=1932789 RepID=UPI003F80DBB7